VISAKELEPLRVLAYPESEHEKEVLLSLQNALDTSTSVQAWWSYEHNLTDGHDRVLVIARNH